MATALSLSNAVVGRLTGDARFVVYDAVVPDNPAQAYAVVYPTAGTSLNRSYAQQPRDLRWQCYVICVGRNRQQTVNTADVVRSLLVGWRIDGAPLNEVPINAQVLADPVLAGDVRYSLTLLFSTTTTRG
jgi:hypothetical protein